MKTSKLAVAVLGALCAMSAEASQYVLQASKWGASQAAAVASAGGTVKFSNDKAGIAVVDSSNPNFLASALRGGAITSGAADMMVQWTQPTIVEEATVNPGDDTYYNHVQWAPQSIEAPAAWALGFDGSGVRVAVIDGGIYDAHVDLAGAVDVAASRSFASGTPDGCVEKFNCDVGTFWHATHVSGIIAARDNTIGVVGIAPRATIVGVKALHNGSGSFGAVISALIYASTDGRADIINMSLGAEFGRSEKGAAELRSALNRAVNFATAHGSLVVVSAGNSAIDFDSAKDYTVTPAESGNAIAVSATGPLGFGLGATDFSRPASYSNYGSSLVWVAGPGGDAALPGNDVCSAPPIVQFCWVLDLVLSTSRGTTVNGGYTWAAGTSMAAPAVSAVAALIKQKYPGATPAQLKTKLAQSATDEGKVGHDDFYGNGYVNARRAVTQ
jgi:lantibiotic leader peptide-processing serine protease